VGVRTDITELRRAEEELRKQHNLLLESLAEGVYGLDLDGRCTFAKRSCVEQLGFDSEAELLGQKLAEMAHVSPACRPCAALEDLRNVLTEATSVLREDCDMRRRQAHKMEAIGQLAGGIAHDFNNILVIVLGFSDLALLEQQGNNELTADHLGEIRRAGLRGRDLIAQLLAFSRDGRASASRRATGATIHEALSLIQPTFPSSVRVVNVIKSPDVVMALPEVELHQAVLNLCINARDALDGAGVVEVRLRRAHGVGQICNSCGNRIHGEFAALEVVDSGQGMDASVFARMFDPFYTTKTDGKGTGMGLSVVHGIVHENGGHLTVTSQLGSGTCFSLYLPIADSNSNIVREDETLLRTEDRGDGEKRSLWVVDDEGQKCRLLSTLFRSRGYEVTAFTNPKAALAAFSETSVEPELLITDQTMPGMSGMELAAAMRLRRPHLPVILCTGSHDQLQAREGLANPVDRMFPKPLDSAALCAVVREFLDPTPAANRARARQLNQAA
jgi:signal transduction histidine kinase/ActR/RegA family two-component response regulator